MPTPAFSLSMLNMTLFYDHSEEVAIEIAILVGVAVADGIELIIVLGLIGGSRTRLRPVLESGTISGSICRATVLESGAIGGIRVCLAPVLHSGSVRGTVAIVRAVVRTNAVVRAVSVMRSGCHYPAGDGEHQDYDQR